MNSDGPSRSSSRFIPTSMNSCLNPCLSLSVVNRLRNRSAATPSAMKSMALSMKIYGLLSLSLSRGCLCWIGYQCSPTLLNQPPRSFADTRSLIRWCSLSFFCCGSLNATKTSPHRSRSSLPLSCSTSSPGFCIPANSSGLWSAFLMKAVTPWDFSIDLRLWK